MLKPARAPGERSGPGAAGSGARAAPHLRRRTAVDFGRRSAEKRCSMLVGKPPNGAKRWPRGQKFALSPVGAAAQDAYRAAVLAARASGRAALDSALAAWAGPRGVAPTDGAILAELSGKRLGIGALCEALDSSGIAADEVRAGIGRLVEAGIVEPLPPASRAVS